MRKNRSSLFIISLVILLSVALTPQRATALSLELALLIDGSGSISGPGGDEPGPEWDTQINAYRNIFTSNFYSTYIEPSPFDDFVVGAFVFSGAGAFDIGNGFVDITISNRIPWTAITNNDDASNFGQEFDNFIQPGGSTPTWNAIDIVVNGGQVLCPAFVGSCYPEVPLPPDDDNGTVDELGILNNGFFDAMSDNRMVIDISTDGNPFQQGVPDAEQLTLDAADAARANGIIINALGVFDPDNPGALNALFLAALVDDTTGDLDGFVEPAAGFDEFEAALTRKIGIETGVIPIPPAVWLFGSGLLGLVGMARRRKN